MSHIIQIGLFGYGVVGQGVYNILQKELSNRVKIQKIVVKDLTKDRGEASPLISFAKEDILDNPEIDLVIEVISDAEEAFSLVAEALQKGKKVITANKKMLADHLQELLHTVENSQGTLLYEASTCGSIPVIQTIDKHFAYQPITSIRGILNGSSNYILSKLNQGGISYAQALAEAQQLGFAEADPKLDVGGYDSLNKLVILNYHAFGAIGKSEEILHFGIQHISEQDIAWAKNLGYKIKLIAQSSLQPNGELISWVLPSLVHSESELYTIENEYNAVQIEGLYTDSQLLKGKGAGSLPTAASIVADVLAVLRQEPYINSAYSGKPKTQADASLAVYVREESPSSPLILKDERFIDKRSRIGRIQIKEVLRRKEELAEQGLFIAQIPEALLASQAVHKEDCYQLV
ncbi:homoserine dehydrogenase [Cytophagales bacterium LB-30]|uniref:Homoserine dehydrogenase n=1 Tax=Shiella aurantiaca TaxID=3058365 RepID=A0ABT8F4J6_9BACT|nr:homoserine dehydrogenase [Shiella aurantiaca]MDN4165289.1 homoserine dehydrogenase [Shiella aurantiaca]